MTIPDLSSLASQNLALAWDDEDRFEADMAAWAADCDHLARRHAEPRTGDAWGSDLAGDPKMAAVYLKHAVVLRSWIAAQRAKRHRGAGTPNVADATPRVAERWP